MFDSMGATYPTQPQAQETIANLWTPLSRLGVLPPRGAASSQLPVLACTLGRMADGCVFCAIVAGTAPAERVYEDASVVAIMDIQPAATGHVLVIPSTIRRTCGTSSRRTRSRQWPHRSRSLT
jgi:Scavenger mRNA decapping enzyme C-term binding